MSVPLLLQDLQNAFTSAPPVQVRTERDLTLGMVVRGVVTGIENLGIVGSRPLWALDVSLDGGLKGRFACSDADFSLLGYSKDNQTPDGLVFHAVLSHGAGPARGGLDLEPSSIYYLTGFTTPYMPYPMPSAAASENELRLDMAS